MSPPPYAQTTTVDIVWPTGALLVSIRLYSCGKSGNNLKFYVKTESRKCRSLGTPPPRLTFQGAIAPHNQKGAISAEKGDFRKISSRTFFSHRYSWLWSNRVWKVSVEGCAKTPMLIPSSQKTIMLNLMLEQRENVLARPGCHAFIKAYAACRTIAAAKSEVILFNVKDRSLRDGIYSKILYYALFYFLSANTLFFVTPSGHYAIWLMFTNSFFCSGVRADGG